MEDCERLVAACVSELGSVDILVNNAGTGHSAPAHREDPADFERVMRTNVFGSYYMSQAVGRALIAAGHGGSIVNVSSVLGLTWSDIPQVGYSASKAALLGLTRDLAAQWSGRRGIRVNTLAPGFFVSEMTAPLLETQAGIDKVLSRTPMGRVGEVDELLGALLLLVSDAGSYITGVTLPVDGGWTMH
jgi:NAD(P)-dependent dehydrogenase (short-subunit alcohol dehydrogenase family)